MNVSKTAIALITAFVMGTLALTGQTYVPLTHDTVCVYQSWASILEQWPDTVLIDPYIVAHTPYCIEIDSDESDMSNLLKKNTVAVALGDTLWLVNSNYLKRNFKGECKHMTDFVPLYFNAKIAFVQHLRPRRLSILEMMLGVVEEDDDYMLDEVAPLYLIEFDNKRVDQIDHKLLSQLLGDYHDLQMRYEGMKDYKETYMINTFFLDYVNRIMRDPEVPYLIERSEVVPTSIH